MMRLILIVIIIHSAIHLMIIGIFHGLKSISKTRKFVLHIIQSKQEMIQIDKTLKIGVLKYQIAIMMMIGKLSMNEKM